VAGISCAALAACDSDQPIRPGRSPSPGTATTTAAGGTTSGPTTPGSSPGGTTGAEGDHLTIVFTPSGGGCIADSVAQEQFSLRTASGDDLESAGAIVEREVGERRDDGDPCAWDVSFSFGATDTAFVVSDESNGVRWGPFSYDEMEALHFELRLTGEPRFNESG